MTIVVLKSLQTSISRSINKTTTLKNKQDSSSAVNVCDSISEQ